MRHLFKPVGILLAGAVLISCDSNKSVSGLDVNVISAVNVSSPVSSIRVGQSVQLVGSALNGRGFPVSDPSISWTTGNAAVATVDKDGKVTGVSPGSAWIIATVDHTQGSVQVSVLSLDAVASVEVSTPINPLPAGIDVQLAVVVRDSIGRTLPGRQITYKSSNVSHVEVSSGGVVRGWGPGTSVVTVTSEGKSAALTLDVVPGPPHHFTMTSAEIFVGGSTQIQAYVSDPVGNKLPGPYAWSSSEPGQVAVSQTGVVTGIAGGGAWITASYQGVSGTTGVHSIQAKQIDGGTFHGCFLDERGIPYCWGRNINGETGMALSFPLTPRPKSIPRAVASLSVGSSHACGLTTDGTAYCWGSNVRGTLGDGTLVDRAVPTAVFGSLKFASISGGHDHTCALIATGVAYCWGGVNYGPKPTEVTGGPAFVAISVGHSVACGLDAGGKVYCWGSNDFGQLGTGDLVSSLTPRAIASSERFTSIASFGWMSCGVTTQNEVHCWGSGDNSGAAPWAPSKKSGSVLFKSVVVGEKHYCGLNLSNVAYCWGANDEGQLGNSSTIAALTEPVLVNVALAGIPGFSSLGAGGAHSCGISVTGPPYCWGRRESLGKASGGNVLEPQLLLAPSL